MDSSQAHCAMMADRHSLPHLSRRSSDTNISIDGVPNITRHDTSSSIGSAKTTPKGNWTLNLSGNCPGCHHHHRSVKVHVKAISDSDHVGDVHCDNCQRLWLAFGRRNSTRISLISTKTTEPEPLETTFRSELIQMIRSATAIAALSPSLAAIPESTSAGPSRESSVRSTAHNGVQNASPATNNPPLVGSMDPSGNTTHAHRASTRVHQSQQSHAMLNKRPAAGTPRFILRVRQKIGARFLMLRSSALGRWFPSKTQSRLQKEEQQPFPEPLPLDVSPVQPLSTTRDADTEIKSEFATSPEQDAPDVSTSSPSAAGTLDSLRALDQKMLQTLTADERIKWMREQITTFKSRYTEPVPSTAAPRMVGNGTQLDLLEFVPSFQHPPPRRHSALAFVGNRFGTFEYWDPFRRSNSTLNGRPISLSETHLSEANTAVEGMSVTSAPHHILIESLQRDRHRSGSPRPGSINTLPQSWQQIHQNRVEARRSFDSAATGGAVRNITTRGWDSNRLPRGSTNRASTIYVMEPSMSQAQIPPPTNEESEHISEQEHHGSPSSPPTP